MLPNISALGITVTPSLLAFINSGLFLLIADESTTRSLLITFAQACPLKTFAPSFFNFNKSDEMDKSDPETL